MPKKNNNISSKSKINILGMKKGKYISIWLSLFLLNIHFANNLNTGILPSSFTASDYINYAFKYLTINTKKKFYYHNFFDYIFINLPNNIKKNYVPVDYFNLEKIKIKKIIKNFSKKNNLGQHDGKKIVNQIINLIK